ncbi:MAG: hypothetical protein GY820_06405 [Gammaproteobacteria bacterium]|nr:hypothetical protein [Gammaproteobacteria bacterium]
MNDSILVVKKVRPLTLKRLVDRVEPVEEQQELDSDDEWEEMSRKHEELPIVSETMVMPQAMVDLDGVFEQLDDINVVKQLENNHYQLEDPNQLGQATMAVAPGPIFMMNNFFGNL